MRGPRLAFDANEDLTMPEFLLIFRPTRATSAADLPARNATARGWVVALKERGVLRAACPLEESGAFVSQEGVGPPAAEGAVASVLLVEASSLDAAVAIARTYPNLVHGSQVEVRPVRPTAPRT